MRPANGLDQEGNPNRTKRGSGERAGRIGAAYIYISIYVCEMPRLKDIKENLNLYIIEQHTLQKL